MKEELKHPIPKIERIKAMFKDDEEDVVVIDTPYPQIKDDINHPENYTMGDEVTDFIASWEMDFSRGNIIKYVTRCPYKNNAIKDLKKAKWYLDNLIEKLENGEYIL